MNLAPLIDHTQLAPHATERDILELCKEAQQAGFAAVCVLPSRVALAARALAGSTVKVCTVVGFPLGANASAVKAEETRLAVKDGAEEVDMVVNLGLLKDGRWNDVESDILAVRQSCQDATLKVIFETGLLTNDEKVLLARACNRCGVDFLKTSTGSTHGGATVEDVALLRSQLAPYMEVKASGGIKTREQAMAMIEAGASRLGTSHGLAIVGAGPKKNEGY